MTAEEKKELRAQIEQLIEELQVQIEDLEEQCKPIPPENALGRITRMDAINNKGVAEANLRSAKRKFNRLKNALMKIEEADFGLCSDCNRAIRPKRMILMPESTKCVRCAARG